MSCFGAPRDGGRAAAGRPPWIGRATVRAAAGGRGFLPTLGTALVGPLLFLGLAAALAGAARAEPEADEPPFQVSLCAEILDGPLCVLGADRGLRIFVAHGPGAEVRVEPTPELGPVEVAGGSRYGLRIPEGVRQLRVEVRDVEVRDVEGRDVDAGSSRAAGSRLRTPAHRRHHLDLAPPEADPDWYRHALALYRQDHLDAALEVVERHGGDPERAAPALPGTVAGSAGAGRALELAYRIHQQRGERQRAEEALLASVLEYRGAGRWASASRQLSNLFYLRLRDRRFAACRELGELWPELPEDGDSAFQQAYYGALLAAKTGELRRALGRVREARRVASRLDRERYLAAAENLQATVLQGLGRHREARELLVCTFRTRADRMSPCERAQNLNSFAWSRILEREAEAGGVGAEAEPNPEGDRGARLGTRHGDRGGPCASAPAPGEPTSPELALLLRGEPRPILEAARQLLVEECPGLPREPFNVRINLAMVELQEGHPEAAERRLEQVRRELPEPPGDLVAWDWELRGRIALHSGEPADALRFYEQLAAFSGAASWPEGEWRASLGKARALEYLERSAEALAAYRSADAQLDWELLWVPVYLGREDLVTLRREASARHLELLLSLGRQGDALELARRQRARTWHHLHRAVGAGSTLPEERRRRAAALASYHDRREEIEARLARSWALPAEHLRRLRSEAERAGEQLRSRLDATLARRESLDPVRLRAPEPGELMLAAFPGTDGWWLFARDSEGISSHGSQRLRRLEWGLVASSGGGPDEGPPQGLARQLAAELLTPFEARLRAAERLTWMPQGRLRQVDLHALPFRGEPLVHHLPVTYALDLPRQLEPAGEVVLPPGYSESHSGAGAASGVLLVSDPAGDLPHARAEAEAVLEQLSAGSSIAELGPFTHLAGLDATGAETRRWLASSEHFHYSGHAFFAGWDSHLPLAEDSRLTVDDVLALPRSPARVVLAGCESGRPLRSGGRETLGLAQAFLVRGSREVIAAVRPVPDADGRRLVEALYRAWAGTDGEFRRGAEALRRAQREVGGGDPASPAFAFRLWAP